MHVVLIDYGAGNLHSVAKTFIHIAKPIGGTVEISADPKRIAAASHVVLPGVGAFAQCMSGLTALPGMLDALSEQVSHKQKPFLGICVGMQMLFEEGHEHGIHKGLGWLKGSVHILTPPTPDYKIPHMGWNNLTLTTQGNSHPLLRGVSEGDHAYFVHSYHAHSQNNETVLATTDYGQIINAVVAQDNIMGTQFHPEKSQNTGLTLLTNFLRI